MLTLDLTNEPRWLDLGHGGVRVRARPLTTALMVARAATRRRGVAGRLRRGSGRWLFAKALTPGARRDWEGVGDADGNPGRSRPGIDALLEVWPIFEAFQATYVSKGLLLDAGKTPPPSPTGLRRGRPLLRLRAGVPDCPARLNRPRPSRAGRSGTSPGPRRPAPVMPPAR